MLKKRVVESKSGDLLDAGADRALISENAGNANVQTTVCYDCRPEEVKLKYEKLFHLSYRNIYGLK